MATLVTMFGGPQTFVKRLNFLHESGLNYIGNEPTFLTVYQYHYANRPALSSNRSHSYIPSSFQATPDGLPGNDDSGAMGSFLAFSMMGLFPNPGQNGSSPLFFSPLFSKRMLTTPAVYLITPPYFESVSVTSPLTGKTATIRNVGFDATYQSIFIQMATLNGVPYTKNWISHEFFLEGGDLVLFLGRNESSWGTNAADIPPSLSTTT